MNTEILEGNKLIAGFITGGKTVRSAGGSRLYIINGIPTKKENLLFHSSWDWLMPVVEKIESDLKIATMMYVNTWDNRGRYNFRFYRELDTDGSIRNQLFEDLVSDSKIESIYNGVIEFIKWYNLNQPPH